MVSADEARAMEHRSDGADEAADVMHMERSALRYVRTVIVLHAIIEGARCRRRTQSSRRTTRPGAVDDRAPRRQIVVTAMSWPSSRDWHVAKGAVRWWALAIDGRPCAWPEVSRG